MYIILQAFNISHFQILAFATVSRKMSGSGSDEESSGNVVDCFRANGGQGEKDWGECLRDGDRDHAVGDGLS